MSKFPFAAYLDALNFHPNKNLLGFELVSLWPVVLLSAK